MANEMLTKVGGVAMYRNTEAPGTYLRHIVAVLLIGRLHMLGVTLQMHA